MQTEPRRVNLNYFVERHRTDHRLRFPSTLLVCGFQRCRCVIDATRFVDDCTKSYTRMTKFRLWCLLFSFRNQTRSLYCGFKWSRSIYLDLNRVQYSAIFPLFGTSCLSYIFILEKGGYPTDSKALTCLRFPTLKCCLNVNIDFGGMV